MKKRVYAIALAVVMVFPSFFNEGGKSYAAETTEEIETVQEGTDEEVGEDLLQHTGLLQPTPIYIEDTSDVELLEPEEVLEGDTASEEETELDDLSEGNPTFLLKNSVKASQIYSTSTQWSGYDKYKTYYYYNQLSSAEQAVWDALDTVSSQILEGSLEVNSDGVPSKMVQMPAGSSKPDIERFFMMFKYSNPQYYFYGGECVYALSGGNYYIAWKVYDQFIDVSARNTATAAVKSSLQTLESALSGYSGETAAKAIFDKEIELTDYNDSIVADSSDEGSGISSNEDEAYLTQSLYSPLVLHETVCAGYTLLYTALCNSLGLDAIGVTSDGHAWNMIRLEGAWLWVDCTWGDNGGSSKDYRFFALSDSDLASVDQSDAHVVEAMWSGLLESAAYSSGASATLESLPTATVETPSISVVANGTTYVITFSTGTSGAYIYYTLDGSTPSVGQSKAQRVSSGSSVTISATKTFSPVAIAAKADMKDSASVTGNELQSIAGATETASTVSYVEYDNRVSITSCTVQPTATSFVYNGQQQAPAVHLYYQGALVPSHYYSVSYPTSVNVGTYVATISGNGSVLQGTTSFPYTITKASLGAPSVSLSNATSGITISWKTLSGATGYIIQRKNGSGYSNLKTVGSNVTKYTDGSVKSKNGATYNYRVRAVGNTNYGESVSASKKIYRLTTPSFSSAKNIKTKSIELKWKKNSKSTGYQIKYVVGSTTKTTKITKNKTLKKVIKKLKKNKTYKVYIRSYKKTSSGTYYSAWSSVKKVKIKK